MQCKDQLDRTISLPQIPKRIISLVPSQTELLVHLGLSERLVGVTKFCVHPEDLRSTVAVVGGTKQVHFNKIAALHPDIIICNKEENTQEMVAELEKIAPIWISDVNSFSNSLHLIDLLGAVFSVEDKARALIREIVKEKDGFEEFMKHKPKKRVAYLIWKDPYMAVGRSTYIQSLLAINKFENIVVDPGSRYPAVTLEFLQEAELILLSSEPYPFKEQHLLELKNALQREVRLVDGEYFSWYGSRLKDAFAYFRTLH